MSATIKVFCKIPNGLQTDHLVLNGSKPHEHIEVGETDVNISIWLKLKKELNQFIENNSIYVDQKEELLAIEAFKTEQFSYFKSKGVPAIRASVEHGELEGFPLIFATEWLESKTEVREDLRDSREAESLSISRKALFNSKCANIIAFIAIVIAIIGIFAQK
ncbi:hypothetical protein HC024_13205 [Methylococcaceae bacterium WWC4]|nr:hypothetical protein [Methylococcaceae bacterium WWC4]